MSVSLRMSITGLPMMCSLLLPGHTNLAAGRFTVRPNEPTKPAQRTT